MTVSTSPASTPATLTLPTPVGALTRGLAGLVLFAVGVLVWWQANLELVKGPREYSLHLLGQTLTLRHGRQILSDGLLTLLVVAPSVLWLEFALVGWRNSSLRRILITRSSSVQLDIACLAAGQMQILRVVGAVLTFGLATWIGRWASNALGGGLLTWTGVAHAPDWAQIGLFFFVYSFFDYWAHRLDHSPMFWPLHRFHHSAEEFCAITSMRAHPAEFTSIFLINLPMAALGAGVDVMISVNLLVTVLGLLIHSNIDSDWGWVGRWVVQSPRGHRLHHIKDISKPVGCYAMVPLWDHLFGTWVEDPPGRIEIGVDTPYAHGYFLFADLLRDYCDLWRASFQEVAAYFRSARRIGR